MGQSRGAARAPPREPGSIRLERERTREHWQALMPHETEASRTFWLRLCRLTSILLIMVVARRRTPRRFGPR